MGYIAMLARKGKDAPEFFDPLSYGREKEPSPELLLRRGRATMFNTAKEAWTALETTLKQATADGDEWPNKFRYSVIEVDTNSNAGSSPVDRRVSRQDLERMRKIATAATQGQWYWGATPCPDKAKAMALFEENLDATAEPADYFHEIYVEDGRRPAIVGNGPTSAANGEFIATFNPANVLLLLDALEALMPADVKVRGPEAALSPAIF